MIAIVLSPRGRPHPICDGRSNLTTYPTMTYTVELDDDVMERIRSHLEEDETPAEFIEELLNMYETEGAFLQEGYSE